MSGPQATRRDIKRLCSQRVVICIAAVTAIWGGLLPALLRCPAIARHVARMEERGVNPAAMYYTELDRLPLRPDWVDRRLTLWP